MSSNRITITAPENAELRRAREWAEQVGTQAWSNKVRAAAEIILALPQPPALTMGEIEWRDARHHLAPAIWHPGSNDRGERVIMLAHITDPADNPTGWIACQREDGMSTTERLATDLTPLEGGKYMLVPSDDNVVDARIHCPECNCGDTDAEQASNPQEKLNSSPEPQPGEAWMIGYGGHEFEAILDDDGEWFCDPANTRYLGTNVDLIGRMALPAGTRILSTVEDYERLSDYSAARGKNEDAATAVFEKRRGLWWETGVVTPIKSERMAEHGPHRLILDADE